MKDQLRELLAERRLGKIADLAARRKRVLGVLTSLTYDADPLIGWRAVEAMGLSADRIADDDPEFVRNHLRRLHWLLSEESGGMCRHAPQAMAEIIRLRPYDFADYASIVIALIDSMEEEDLGIFRAGILWSIGRLAAVAAEEASSVAPSVVSCLNDPDPQVRGLAVWCLKEMGRGDLLRDRAELLADKGPVDLYSDGMLRRTRVCALMRD